MIALGVPLRLLAAGVYVGRVAQLEVHATCAPRSGWRICAVDGRTGRAVAYGSGSTLERAERRAQDDFARRRAAWQGVARHGWARLGKAGALVGMGCGVSR